MNRILYIKTEFLIVTILCITACFQSEISAQTYLVNSGKVVFGSSSTQLTVDNLNNNSGGSLNLNGGTVNINGSFVNSGTYDGTGTLTFSGNAQQNLNGVSIMNNLTINNSSGVVLSNDILVNNNVNLANGILTLGSYNLTLSTTASVTGSFSSSKMINASGTGQLIKKFSSTGSFTYPIGDNSSYSPVDVNFTSGTFAENANLGVNVKNVKHPNNTSLNDYLNRYWSFNPNGITDFNYNLTLAYNTGDVAGSESNIYLGKYYGSAWNLYGVANIVAHTLSLSGANSFGDFTGGQQGAMPVVLADFNSFVYNRDVLLKWITASEENNSGFKIERTDFDKGKENWEQVGFVKGKGSLNSVSEYSFTDSKLIPGKYKYRIRQLDLNGNFSVYNLNGVIDISNPVKYALLQNYPNPFNPYTKIDFELPEKEKVSMIIYDITGRNVMTVLNNKDLNAGFHSLNINAAALSSGVYFYKIKAGKFEKVKKMVKIN